MRPAPELLAGRRTIMAGHAGNPGFRALAVTDDGTGETVGFGYGFHGAAGQWWHDTVSGRWPPAAATEPPRPGSTTRSRSRSCTWCRATRAAAWAPGVLLRLTAGRPERTALLSTRDADTPARRLYRGPASPTC